MAERLPDDVRVVDCAGCRAVLAGDSVPQERAKALRLPRIAGRIHGRPYCAGCLAIAGAGVSGLAGGLATDHGSPSPWLEGSTRALEDGPRG